MTEWWGPQRGTAGDMFGAINSLFSGLAFAGIIFTISMQRKDLSLQLEAIKMQTEELKLQREETARSADQLESQKNLLNFQIALSALVEMIKTKEKRLSSVKYKSNDELMQGVAALREMYRVKRSIQASMVNYQILSGFFNSFFFMLRFIKESDLTDSQKKVLAGFLYSDTSDIEIIFIFENHKDKEEELALLSQFDFHVMYEKVMKAFKNQ
ncbi:hypothetical protein [Cohnella sp. GbtcB17]|uniref:hypothetical protein n=1 Tax=Cohnella sp. GbtcB17 TaxID=2824762 RepID=UPI001C301275|nr:hypothetical protein [Cohnella sp. GbtcB17]